MKTKTIELYEHADLLKPENEEVKDRVLDWVRENWTLHETWYFNEAWESLRKYAALFGAEVRSVDFLEPYRNVIRMDNPEGTEGMSPLRLRTWLINNILPGLEQGKYYSTRGQRIDGKYHYKSRRSKVQTEIDCPLTGVCYDMPLIDPLLEFIKSPDNSCVCDIFEAGVKRLCKDVQSEYEYRQTEEAILEDIEANGYVFDESGKCH